MIPAAPASRAASAWIFSAAVALLSGDPLQSVHHLTSAGALRVSNRPANSSLPAVVLSAAASEKFGDRLLGVLERRAPGRELRHQRAHLGIVLPLVLDVVERRTCPHGGQRDFRHLGLDAWPVRIARIGGKSEFAGCRQRRGARRSRSAVSCLASRRPAADQAARWVVGVDCADHEGRRAAQHHRKRHPVDLVRTARSGSTRPHG